MRIGKIFRFEAAHRLPYHLGKCASEHGHSYKVEITLDGPVHDPLSKYPDAGMVADFYDLSQIWKEALEPYLDHCKLNDSLSLRSPTAEMIAAWIAAVLRESTFGELLQSVKVWETESSWAMTFAHDPMVELLLTRGATKLSVNSRS